MTQPTQHDRIIAWTLVAGQGILIVAIVIIPRRHAWDYNGVVNAGALGGVGVAAMLGLWAVRHLGSGLTPLPLPNGAVDLVVRGPYRWVRHPIYTAVIIGLTGIAVRSRTPAAIAVAVLLAAFLAIKARWEEIHLQSAFPGYREYQKTTGRLLPGLGRLKTQD
jgi:protein-S-isoprenylcysteine O-methyltransferase Ste14